MPGKKKTYEDDDGRVVASMNVDGMPWYIREHRPWQKRQQSQSSLDLTREEERAVMWGAVKAGLLVAGVFILGALLFILFCLYIWYLPEKKGGSGSARPRPAQ